MNLLTMLNLLGQSVKMSYESCGAMPYRLVGKSIFSHGKPNKEHCKFTDVAKCNLHLGVYGFGFLDSAYPDKYS